MITKKQVIAELVRLKFGKVKAENLLEKHIDIYEVKCDEEFSTAKTIAIDIEEAWLQEDEENA